MKKLLTIPICILIVFCICVITKNYATGNNIKMYSCSFVNEKGTSVSTFYEPGKGAWINCNTPYRAQNPEQCEKDRKTTEKMYQEGKCKELPSF